MHHGRTSRVMLLIDLKAEQAGVVEKVERAEALLFGCQMLQDNVRDPSGRLESAVCRIRRLEN